MTRVLPVTYLDTPDLTQTFQFLTFMSSSFFDMETTLLAVRQPIKKVQYKLMFGPISNLEVAKSGGTVSLSPQEAAPYEIDLCAACAVLAQSQPLQNAARLLVSDLKKINASHQDFTLYSFPGGLALVSGPTYEGAQDIAALISNGTSAHERVASLNALNALLPVFSNHLNEEVIVK